MTSVQSTVQCDDRNKNVETAKTPGCCGCPHHQDTEWSVLDPQSVQRLNQVRRPKDFLPGEPIYHEGDEPSGAYCIGSGLVGIRKTDADGESVLLRLVRPGEIFGFRSFITGEAHAVSAEALTECRVCHLPASAAKALTDDCPQLTTRFFEHLARDMARTETKVLETVTAPSRLRFLRLLIALGGAANGKEEDAGDTAGASTFDLPLSRQDIASLIGVRPESMSRMIRAIHDEGLVKFHGRRVEVPDLNRLETESLGEAAA